MAKKSKKDGGSNVVAGIILLLIVFGLISAMPWLFILILLIVACVVFYSKTASKPKQNSDPAGPVSSMSRFTADCDESKVTVSQSGPNVIDVYIHEYDTTSLSQQSEHRTKTKYLQLLTAGDERVCPMCAQFDEKIFLESDAPKLPFCPSCRCAYIIHLDEEDLPLGATISKKSDFVLPAKCISSIHKNERGAYEETDINARIRFCENQGRKLKEFMEPYISAGFSIDELAYRDLLPDLYMQLGEWEKAEKVISRCIGAGAYYPENGAEQLAAFEMYQKVVTETLAYISTHPGCLQSSIYKKMGYNGEERELLKGFLQNSQLISKVRYNKTYRLYKANQ